MSEALGLEPDEVIERASRVRSPPVPIYNGWVIDAGDSDSKLGNQIERLLRRLDPVLEAATRLADELLAESGTAGVRLNVTRYFETASDESGEEDGLGFYLPADELAILARLRARVDIAECDLTED